MISLPVVFRGFTIQRREQVCDRRLRFAVVPIGGLRDGTFVPEFKSRIWPGCSKSANRKDEKSINSCMRPAHQMGVR
jgi:hypothetical protein